MKILQNNIESWLNNNGFNYKKIEYFSTSIVCQSQAVLGHLFTIHNENFDGGIKVLEDGTVDQVYANIRTLNNNPYLPKFNEKLSNLNLSLFDEERWDKREMDFYSPTVEYIPQGFRLNTKDIKKVEEIYYFWNGVIENYLDIDKVCNNEGSEKYPTWDNSSSKGGTVKCMDKSLNKFPVVTYFDNYENAPAAYKYYLEDWEHKDRIFAYRYSSDTAQVEYKDPEMMKLYPSSGVGM